MSASMQWFSPTTARFLRRVGESATFSPACYMQHAAGIHRDPKMVQGKLLHNMLYGVWSQVKLVLYSEVKCRARSCMPSLSSQQSGSMSHKPGSKMPLFLPG